MSMPLQLVPPPVQDPMSITAPEFLPKLAAFNDLTRAMRDAGIKVEQLEFLDNTMFIHVDSLDVLSRRFAHEVRSQRYRTDGKFTRHCVTIRGVDVVWFGLVKEQDR